MDRKGRLRAVELLCLSNRLDPEENDELRELFMFLFALQDDHEAFCQEIMDKRQMQAFSAFDT